eukprot:COSAG04_NODE_252_length_18819_cov_8.853312_1_plen_158_part_00
MRQRVVSRGAELVSGWKMEARQPEPPEPQPETEQKQEEPAGGDVVHAQFRCRDIIKKPREPAPAASPSSDRQRAAAAIDLIDGGGEKAAHLLPSPLPPLEDWLAGLGASELLEVLLKDGYDTGALPLLVAQRPALSADICGCAQLRSWWITGWTRRT